MRDDALAEKLAALIKKEKGISVEARLFKFRPSQSERASGAWKWAMYLANGSLKQIGSTETATRILRAARRDYSQDPWGNYEIDEMKAKRS